MLPTYFLSFRDHVEWSKNSPPLPQRATSVPPIIKTMAPAILREDTEAGVWGIRFASILSLLFGTHWGRGLLPGSSIHRTHFGGFLDCGGSSLLSRLFSSYDKMELLSSCSAWPSHFRGFSCHGAQALGHVGFSSFDTQAQELWLPGLVAPQYVRSSWTRDWAHVHCVGRQILNHWTMREVLKYFSI